jgi:hypothetical protein
MHPEIQLAYLSLAELQRSTIMYHLPAKLQKLVEKARGCRLVYANKSPN